MIEFNCPETIYISTKNIKNDCNCLNLKDSNIFTIEKFEFKAPSFQIKKEWDQALEKLYQLPPPDLICSFFETIADKRNKVQSMKPDVMQWLDYNNYNRNAISNSTNHNKVVF